MSYVTANAVKDLFSFLPEHMLLNVRHRVDLVGTFWVIAGPLLILAGIAIGLATLAWILSGQIFLMASGGSANGGWYLATFFVILAICSVTMGVISITAGLALRARRGWARAAIIILSLINLINFPFGTGLSLYSLVVLFWPDVAVAFRETQAVR